MKVVRMFNKLSCLINDKGKITMFMELYIILSILVYSLIYLFFVSLTKFVYKGHFLSKRKLKESVRGKINNEVN